MHFYCPKCQDNREVERFEELVTQRNRRVARAICPVCGSALTRLMGKAVQETQK